MENLSYIGGWVKASDHVNNFNKYYTYCNPAIPKPFHKRDKIYITAYNKNIASNDMDLFLSDYYYDNNVLLSNVANQIVDSGKCTFKEIREQKGFRKNNNKYSVVCGDKEMSFKIINGINDREYEKMNLCNYRKTLTNVTNKDCDESATTFNVN